MEKISEKCERVFKQAIWDYHQTDDVDTLLKNPYEEKGLLYYLYLKNWIDNVQWHLEDIIRAPDIHPEKALILKRRIDKSNQDRTDLVELIDSFFHNLFKGVTALADATINTESPAWAVDRLSILTIKIYHMERETERTDVTEEHSANCKKKLGVLLEQETDLADALDRLLDDYANGRKYMKVYKQMKMYNDPSLNPVLYNNKTNV